MSFSDTKSDDRNGMSFSDTKSDDLSKNTRWLEATCIYLDNCCLACVIIDRLI